MWTYTIGCFLLLGMLPVGSMSIAHAEPPGWPPQPATTTVGTERGQYRPGEITRIGGSDSYANVFNAPPMKREPYVQIPLPEFKVLIGRVANQQEQSKLKDQIIKHQSEMITIKDEKDKLQTDYIAKMEQADEQRERYVEKLEALANDPRWADRATWAGYGAAVPIVVQVVRKIILKF